MGIVEKLRTKVQRFLPTGGGSVSSDGEVTSYITDDGMRLVNPDGPEAAAEIERLTARVGELEKVLTLIQRRLETIAAFGDPSEIAKDPEKYGGTDDGLETVCMAYENMQSTAAAALAEARATLNPDDRT